MKILLIMREFLLKLHKNQWFVITYDYVLFFHYVGKHVSLFSMNTQSLIFPCLFVLASVRVIIYTHKLLFFLLFIDNFDFCFYFDSLIHTSQEAPKCFVTSCTPKISLCNRFNNFIFYFFWIDFGCNECWNLNWKKIINTKYLYIKLFN